MGSSASIQRAWIRGSFFCCSFVVLLLPQIFTVLCPKTRDSDPLSQGGRGEIMLRWPLPPPPALGSGTWPSKPGWRFRTGRGKLSATSCRSCWRCCRSSWCPPSWSQWPWAAPRWCWRWWRWTCPWWGWPCSWCLPSRRCWAFWTAPWGRVSTAEQKRQSRESVSLS